MAFHFIWGGFPHLQMHLGALIRGVLNGMVEELLQMYGNMEPLAKERARVLVGSGNGIRLNEPLREMVEKRLGMKIRIPVHQEEAAFGSVLFSLAAAGVYPDLERVRERMIHYCE